MTIISTPLIVGDSFSPEGLTPVTWPQRISPRFPYQNLAASGDKLVTDIEPTFATDVTNRPANCDIAIIQGGVNDIQANDTAADIQTAVDSCIATAQAAGLDVIVINVAPWKNAVTWSAGEQTVTDDYNTYLAAQESIQGFTLVDIYAALESASADELDAAYDSGDGLHPNAAGQDVIAGLVDTAIAPFLETSSVANDLKLWRGAVEPAETGASGNEIKLYRGAVEPALAATFGGAAVALANRSGLSLAIPIKL